MSTHGELVCSRAFECKGSYVSLNGFTHEELFRASEAECTGRLSDPAPTQAAVDAGRVIYDAAAAAQCVDEARSMSCAMFWDTWASYEIPSCEAVFAGTIPDGAACTLWIECTSGFCDRDIGQCRTLGG